MRIMRTSGCICLLATGVLLTGVRAEDGRTSDDFASAKDLREAVEMAKGRLERDGKPEYAALLSESRVREVIPTAIQSYKSLLNRRDEEKNPGSEEYFRTEIEPKLIKIAEEGEWPDGCSFFWFYTLHDGGVSYSGLGLRLRIDTPDSEHKAFALPIIDLYFGRGG